MYLIEAMVTLICLRLVRMLQPFFVPAEGIRSPRMARTADSTTCQLHRANYLSCCNRLDCIRIGLLRYAIIFTQTSPKRTTSDDLISLKQEAASQRGKAQVCRTKVTDRTDAVTEASQQSPTNSRRTKHTEQHARATSLLDLVVLWHRPIHLLSEQRAGGQQRGVARR